MRISDWSSDVCSSDLLPEALMLGVKPQKLDEVAAAIAPRIKGVPLLLSILAGVEVAALAKRYEEKAIVRVMPNLPFGLGTGVVAQIGRASGRARVCQYVMT